MVDGVYDTTSLFGPEVVWFSLSVARDDAVKLRVGLWVLQRSNWLKAELLREREHSLLQTSKANNSADYSVTL